MKFEELMFTRGGFMASVANGYVAQSVSCDRTMLGWYPVLITPLAEVLELPVAHWTMINK